MLYFSVLWMHTVATSCRGGQTAPAIAKVVFFAKSILPMYALSGKKLGSKLMMTIIRGGVKNPSHGYILLTEIFC